MKARGLLDRKLGGFRALENLVDVIGGAAEEIGKILAIAHHSTGRDVFALRKHRRQPVLKCKLGNSLALSEENRIARKHNSPDPFLGESSERAFDLLWVARLHRHKREASFLSGVLRALQDGRIGRGVWIAEETNTGNIGYDCGQQLQLFGRDENSSSRLAARHPRGCSRRAHSSRAKSGALASSPEHRAQLFPVFTPGSCEAWLTWATLKARISSSNGAPLRRNMREFPKLLRNSCD